MIATYVYNEYDVISATKGLNQDNLKLQIIIKFSLYMMYKIHHALTWSLSCTLPLAISHTRSIGYHQHKVFHSLPIRILSTTPFPQTILPY